MCGICTRREFMRAISAIGAASVLPGNSFAQAAAVSASAVSRLPARSEFVIRNASLITMDRTLGDLATGAIHVRNGQIMSVAKAIDIPGVSVIDGTGMIVLPGLIDTHWHMWHTLFRGLSGDKQADGFFPTVTRFCGSMMPADMYQSTRLAAAEGLNAGITTVHSWCHNIRSREHAEADIQAINDVGLRGRWSFGQALDQPADQLIRIGDLQAMHRDWSKYSNDGMLSLGMAWRGVFRGNAWLPPEVYKTEFDAARNLGIPISVHIGTLKASKGHIEAHYKEKLIGPDVNVVHACSASDAEIKMIKDSGASVSILPHSEMRGGWGYPLLGEFINAGVPTAIGVDTSALAGDANLFGVMKFAVAMENGRSGSEFKLTAHRALELATIDAARVMGLENKVGSLTPGKRADIIMVSTNSLNMAFATDPAHLLVESAQPSNVEMVVSDGRILKRDGKLVALNPAAIVAEARAAQADVRKRANWR